MPTFYAISLFRNQICELCKKKKDAYYNILRDLYTAIGNTSIEEIRINRDMVYDDESVVIVKFRVANSASKLSKKDGFRLIYLAFKNSEDVVFLYVYPKRGKYGLNNISDSFFKELIKTYMEEKKIISYVSVTLMWKRKNL